MNYIQEINAFYTRKETNPLSGSATTLWHALMHVNNRAHWVKEFSVSASVLCSKSGLPLSTFKRARAELCEKGYILHQSRGTKAPVYQMVSLVDHQSGEFLDGDVLVGEGRAEREVPESGREREESRREVDKAAEEDEDLKARKEIDLMIENYLNGGTLADIGLKADSKVDRDVSQGVSREISEDVDRDMSRDVGGDASPLYKQNKTKTKQNFHSSSRREASNLAYPFYLEHFGEPSKHIQQELKIWIEGLGDELVYEALKRTVENGKTSWRYTVGILKRWKVDGLKTVEDVLAAEENFRKKRHAGSRDSVGSSFYGGRYRNKREAVVPDWFRKHQEEQKKIYEKQQSEMLYG